jgi:hypothetical protein
MRNQTRRELLRGTASSSIGSPHPQTAGGNDAGCVTFIERRLAGPYGKFARLPTGAASHHGTTRHGRTMRQAGALGRPQRRD